MVCSNIFQHIGPLTWLGEGMCDLESGSQSYLAAAGFEPYHIVFMAFLLTLLIIVGIKTTFKGHDVSIGLVFKIAIVVGGLIVLGII
jgi:hypothetical protein